MILTITFSGECDRSPTEMAAVVQGAIHRLLPPWKYISSPMGFKFNFERNPNGFGWSLREGTELLDVLTQIGTIRPELEASLSEDDAYVSLQVSLRGK